MPLRAGGREAPRGHGTGAPPSCSSRSHFFTRISPCGRLGGAETFPARSPASLSRVKQPFCRQRTLCASPPTPSRSLPALSAHLARHAQHGQLRGGRARDLPPAAIGSRLSRSATRLVNSARRAGRGYKRFRGLGAPRLGREEVRVVRLRLRAGAVGGHAGA